MTINDNKEERLALAGTVRAALLEQAHLAWEQALVSGLCHEGAFEAAMGAVQMLDLEHLLEQQAGGAP